MSAIVRFYRYGFVTDRPFATTVGLAGCRETLASLLWLLSDSVRARGALRRTLSALKAKIDRSALTIGREEVRLEPATYVCNVDEFRELIARARSHGFSDGSPHARGSTVLFERGHLDHLGLDVADAVTFESLRHRLAAHGATDGAVVDFGVSRNVWFEDPDGHGSGIVLWVGAPLRRFDDRVVEPYVPAATPR